MCKNKIEELEREIERKEEVIKRFQKELSMHRMDASFAICADYKAKRRVAIIEDMQESLMRRYDPSNLLCSETPYKDYWESELEIIKKDMYDLAEENAHLEEQNKILLAREDAILRKI